jgi:hypothetical protein
VVVVWLRVLTVVVMVTVGKPVVGMVLIGIPVMVVGVVDQSCLVDSLPHDLADPRFRLTVFRFVRLPVIPAVLLSIEELGELRRRGPCPLADTDRLPLPRPTITPKHEVVRCPHDLRPAAGAGAPSAYDLWPRERGP